MKRETAQTEKDIFRFERDELRALIQAARNFIRFRDRKMIGFTFTFDTNYPENLKKLTEGRSLLYYIIWFIQKKSVPETEDADRVLIKKIKDLIGYIDSLDYDYLLSDYNRNTTYGKSYLDMEMAKLVINNMEDIMNLLNLFEILRPLGVKPLGRTTVGLTTSEFAEIAMEEPDSEEI